MMDNNSQAMMDNTAPTQDYPQMVQPLEESSLPMTENSHTGRPSRKQALQDQQQQPPKSSMEVWEELRQETKDNASTDSCPLNHSTWGMKATGHTCLYCAERDRKQLRQYRQLAEEYPNIYSWVYLDPVDFDQRWPRHVVMLSIAVSIQVIVPAAIIMQLADEVKNSDLGFCRNTKESLGFGKFLAFILSLYFGVVSLVSFLGKLRGNAFLLIFGTPICAERNYALVLGFFSQNLGIVVANIAEYLLFLGRGTEDYLLMFFTALTMQATLNADSANLITPGKSKEAEEIIGKVFTGENLDLGRKGDPLPKDLAVKLHKFRRNYNGAAIFVGVAAIALTGSVTFCI